MIGAIEKDIKEMGGQMQFSIDEKVIEAVGKLDEQLGQAKAPDIVGIHAVISEQRAWVTSQLSQMQQVTNLAGNQLKNIKKKVKTHGLLMQSNDVRFSLFEGQIRKARNDLKVNHDEVVDGGALIDERIAALDRILQDHLNQVDLSSVYGPNSTFNSELERRVAIIENRFKARV